MLYLLPPFLAFILSLLLTKKVRRLALRFNIVDAPTEERKIQKGHVPLLGGLAVYLSFVFVLIVCWLAGWLSDGKITTAKILAIIFGGLVICLVGFWDDRCNIRTKSFLGPFLASLVAVGAGITIGYITNPFLTGTGPYGRALLYFGGALGSILSFLWLLVMMYTTKFLDGLDGLVSGIGAIGSIILFIVSLFWDVPQSGTSILCLILAGSCLGFLIHNWHPASIFLGESGSVFIGFMLGVLAIISGGKIATTLLIMGIPLLDLVWVVLRRVFKERKSPFSGDRKHLHFRLLDAGFSHRGAVLFLYLLTIFFGSASLFLQSKSKVIALAIMGLFMVILGYKIVQKYNNKNQTNKT